MYDNKNLQIGDTVLVSDPGINDDWIQEFVGSINDIVDCESGSLYIVEDQESNLFQVGENQITLFTWHS